jgi:hypothetical protein
MATVLTIDPGLTGTGLAVWDAGRWRRELCLPISVQNLYGGNQRGYVERASHLADAVARIAEEGAAAEAYLEYPAIFSSSARGYAAAVRGDIVKLSYFVGVLSRALNERGTSTILVTVEVWKGQLSKPAVEARIRRLLPEIDSLKVKSHSWDAVGIGLWRQGHFR